MSQKDGWMAKALFVQHQIGVCAKKASFATETQAMNLVRRKAYNQRAYKCPICATWHLSKRHD